MDRKPTVLVVDDSQISRKHLLRILQDDYVVHVAAGGVEAIQIASVAKPDIILLDIVMPQMDGFDVLIRIREMRETATTPVIFITSLDQEGDEAKGLALGANDYIMKPYNPTIVKLRIQVQLRLSEQMRVIEELSSMDAATKLPRRSYFEKRLHEEWKRAADDKRRLGCVMIVTENLRLYNREYGHRVGDAMLAQIARIVESIGVNNPGDIAARWEYNRFVVLVQNASASDVHELAERMRVAVCEAEILNPAGERAGLTLTLGVASAEPGADDCDEQKFIANADSALFVARELGSNRVAVHS